MNISMAFLIKRVKVLKYNNRAKMVKYNYVLTLLTTLIDICN